MDTAELSPDNAARWDLRGEVPPEVLRSLGRQGVLCAEVPEQYGGPGLSSLDNGALTAEVGEVCGSVRSVMTSQGIAAATLLRFGSDQQRRAYLRPLTGGATAAVAFSEGGAGSDLSAVATEIRATGGGLTVTGSKTWVTGAVYATWIVVFGRWEAGAGIVLVPAEAPGVTVERIADPLGCRAAGHAQVTLDRVRLPADHLLGGAGMPIAMLATSALTYGRVSVAWGCVGIIRACLRAASGHAATRKVAGTPLREHQLVQRHLAELLAAERTATLVCEQASRQCDDRAPEHVSTAVLAKHVAARNAATAAATAVQVLASAGARDGQVVARAYRDAKLMEIIEGSTEICQLLLADRALAVWA
jgi:methoxymalonate biosynthesis protein